MAGIRVHRIDDLELGVDGLPPTEGIRLVLEQGGRVIVRPSGTEPKVKCYLQVIESVPHEVDGLATARAAARARRDLMAADVQALLTQPAG
ncbi:MAG: hypothetical protein ACKOE2_15725 [Actinomycetales bacterium]